MPFDQPVAIVGGPDISNWAETGRITRIEFTRSNFLVRHSKEGKRPDSWPPQHVPGWGDADRGGSDPGDIQWTLYIVVNVEGQWRTGPCILFWPDHYEGVGGPFSDGARNWWYQHSAMAGRQPGPGQRVGVMAVAGALRGLDVRNIAERTPIAWVTVPADDTGVFDIADMTPAPPPAPAPVPEEPAPAPPVPIGPTQTPLPPLPPLPIEKRLHDQLEAVTDGLTLAVQGLLMVAKALQQVTKPR